MKHLFALFAILAITQVAYAEGEGRTGLAGVIGTEDVTHCVATHAGNEGGQLLCAQDLSGLTPVNWKKSVIGIVFASREEAEPNCGYSDVVFASYRFTSSGFVKEGYVCGNIQPHLIGEAGSNR